MELSTWQEAVKKCSNRGGKMFPFVTGLDQLRLKHEIDVWTADYLIISGSKNGNGPINNFCFDGIKTTITQMTVRGEKASDKSDTSTKQPKTGMTTSVDNKTKVNKIHTQEDEQSLDLWIHVVIPLGVVLLLTFGITFIIYVYRKRLQKRERIDQPTNISNLTTVSGQNDYKILDHRQSDEHKYSSARQVNNDRVAMKTYVNDVVYREDNGYI